MVQKNLIIFLELLWITPPLIAKRSLIPQFQKTNKINSREEDEIVNSPQSCTSFECSLNRTSRDGVIDIRRWKRDTGIQYRHEKKEDVTGFIPKLIARPEYGTVYQHQGMLLQNLHHRYLYIVIRLPHLKDLDQKIPSFPNCDNYGIHRASNPNPLNDDTKSNDNELHQQLCGTFKIDYLQEMDIIMKVKARLECKINVSLPAFLPNKIVQDSRGLVTSSEKTGHEEQGSRNKRAIPLLVIAQGTAAIGGMLIKGINTLVDAKRVNSFNNAIEMLNANIDITHNRLVTLENRTSMMAKAIMPILKDLKLQINKTNDQLASQYRMMSSAHNRYNLLFRQTHETQMIHHFALLLFKNYLTIQVGTLQRIHQQYIRYESALDDTLIDIENLNSGYLTHLILDPQVLSKYLEIIEGNLEGTAPEYEPVFTSVYQYYGNSLASFSNTLDFLLLQLPILIKLKVQVPMSLFSIETVPVPLDAETYLGEKREYTQIILKTEYIALTDNNYVPLTQVQISLCTKIGYTYYC